MTVKPDEWRPLLWSFSYFFSLLCGYCIIRPMRDEMGIADGRQKGIEQMEQSKQRMGIGVIDLMQIHNLRDWKTHPCKIA